MASLTDQTVVAPEGLQCSEFCFVFDVDFKIKYNPGKTEIFKRITALMNTSGGVVSIKSRGPSTDVDLDKWKQGLDAHIQSKLPQTCYAHCIKIYDEETSGQLNVHVIVKKFSCLVTIDHYAMYMRGSIGNVPVREIELVGHIMKTETREVGKLSLPELLQYDTVVSVKENMGTEFKCWKTENVQDIIIKLKKDMRTINCILAMPNLPTGGHLCLGIEEDRPTGQLKIRGQKLKETEETELISAIQSMLCTDPHSEDRIWGDTEQRPEKGKHWDIKFLEVQGCPDQDRRVVIVVTLKHCMGGVFLHKPQCFKVNRDTGNVDPLEFDVWKKAILDYFQLHFTMSSDHMKRHKTKQNIPSSTTHSNVKRKNDNLVTPSTPLKRPKPGVRSASEEVTDSELMASLSSKDSISWSKDNAKWKDNILFGPAKLSKTVPTIENVIESSSPLRFVPTKDILINRVPQYKDQMRNCTDDIVKYHGNNEGFVIACNDWLKNILISLKVPGKHVVDMLSLDASCKIRLVSVFTEADEENDKTEQISYSKQLARLIKLHVLGHVDCDFSLGQSIYIKADVCILHSAQCHQRTLGFLDTICERFLCGSSSQWDTMQVILGVLLLNTTFKQSIGDNCLIRLTMEQAEVLLPRGAESQMNLIEGPPGSGKTILALQVARFFDHDQCLMMCKNLCLKKYLDYQVVSKTKLIANDEDLLGVLDSDEFAQYQCLIIDDCHNLQLRTETWQRLFKSITYQYLFIFMDNDIQSFHPQESDSVKEVFGRFTQQSALSYRATKLTNIQRNTLKVVSFLNAGFGHNLTCGHDEDGDDVELKKTKNLRSDTADNGLIKYLKELLDSGAQNMGNKLRYEQRDIAILVVDRDDAIFYSNLITKHMGDVKVHGADTFPVVGVIVEVVDNFGGLDAKVCVLVAPDIHSKSTGRRDPVRHFDNRKFKAFVASRGVYRVVFLTDTDISVDTLNGMYIDRTSLLTQRSSVDMESSSSVPEGTSDDDTVQLTPLDVAVCPLNGKVVFVNHTDSKIYVWTSSMTPITRFRPGRPSTLEESYYEGVAIDSKGLSYVTDSKKNCVHISTLDGCPAKPICRIGDVLKGPKGITIDPNDTLFICDEGNFRIQVFTSDGDFVRGIVLPQSAPNIRAPNPLFIAANQKHLAVTDAQGDLHILAPDGASIKTLRRDMSVCRDPSKPAQLGRFGRARGVALDPDGNVIVADSEGGRLHVLVPEALTEGWTVGRGPGENPGFLFGANGIAVTADGHVVVTERRNHRIQKLLCVQRQ